MSEAEEALRRDEISQALAYADEYFERSMVGKSIQGGDHIQTLAAAYRAQAEQLRELREAGEELADAAWNQSKTLRPHVSRFRAALSRSEADG